MRRRSRQRMRRRSRLEQRKPESDPRRSELLDQRVCSENRRPWGSCAGSPPPWSSTTPACTQTHTRSCLGRPSCRSQAWNKRWQCWMRRGRPAPACCTRGWWGWRRRRWGTTGLPCAAQCCRYYHGNWRRGRRGVGWSACWPVYKRKVNKEIQVFGRKRKYKMNWAQEETDGNGIMVEKATGLESRGGKVWLAVELDDDPINQGGIQISNPDISVNGFSLLDCRTLQHLGGFCPNLEKLVLTTIRRSLTEFESSEGRPSKKVRTATRNRKQGIWNQFLWLYNCTLYIVHCTLYTLHCTLYIVHCTLYIVHFRIICLLIAGLIFTSTPNNQITATEQM